MMQDNLSPQAISVLPCHKFCSIDIFFLLLLLCVHLHNGYFMYLSSRRGLRMAASISEKPLSIYFFGFLYYFQFRLESSECTCTINNEVCIIHWPSHKYHCISDSQHSCHTLNGNASASAEATVIHLTWRHYCCFTWYRHILHKQFSDSELQGQNKCSKNIQWDKIKGFIYRHGTL